MSNRRIAIAVGVAVVAALVGGAAAWALSDDPESSTRVRPPDPSAAVETKFPGLTPASGEPQLPGIRTAHPEVGTVERVAGPFDDRFTLSRLRLGDDAVSGRLDVTSDVSELLELQVLAGFYDARGHLLGTRRFTHHFDEGEHEAGPPAEFERFKVAVPAAMRDTAVSAAVGVPVLVNE